jgi:hypothetical protein
MADALSVGFQPQSDSSVTICLAAVLPAFVLVPEMQVVGTWKKMLP